MMDLQKYIDENMIVSVGINSSDYIAFEVIVENPEELIKLVCANNCFISEILWWEYCKIGVVPVMGHGGPRDPRSPQNYYFAETDVQRPFEPITTEKEYLDYLDGIRNTYLKLKLFPSFTIKKKCG